MSTHGSTPDLAQLAADHHAAVYRYAYRLAGRQADAEDLTQQTFLRAQKCLHQLRDPQAAQGWLFAILRSCWQAALRTDRRTPVALLGGDVEALPDEWESDEIDEQEIQAAIQELAPEFRAVLLLFYFEECSYREIAEKLQLPIGTVMSRLSRAKSHLRARLNPEERAGDVPGAHERRDHPAL